MDKSLMPKTKHDHKWTDKLKVIIFAFLMLAPLFSVLVKCLYTLNPNAKDSYYGKTINEEQNIYLQRTTDINSNKTYYLNPLDLTYELNTQSVQIYTKDFAIVDNGALSTSQINALTNNTILVIEFRTNNTQDGRLINYFTIENNQTRYIAATNQIGYVISFKIIATSTNQNAQNVITSVYTKEYNKYSYLDNVFYYSVNQIKEDNLFKWVENTIVYDGLNAMNTGFGLSSNHVLTYLLAYWTILTAIYIVIDIILFLFTKLTHLLQ